MYSKCFKKGDRSSNKLRCVLSLLLLLVPAAAGSAAPAGTAVVVGAADAAALSHLIYDKLGIGIRRRGGRPAVAHLH